MVETILNSIFALLFVLALIFAMAYFYKKRKKTSSLIDVVAYQPVGQKLAVAVVKIQDELLFFGIGQNDFKLLKKIPLIKEEMDKEINISIGDK